ncbi:MAG: hypothetical protein AAGH41_13510 [Pseudomonadota bacterium]
MRAKTKRTADYFEKLSLGLLVGAFFSTETTRVAAIFIILAVLTFVGSLALTQDADETT